MKKLISSTLLVIFTLTMLTGCKKEAPIKSSNDYFEKKIMCQKFIPGIKSRIEAEHDDQATLQGIYYVPQKNTCIAYITSEITDPNFLSKQHAFEDILTGEVVDLFTEFYDKDTFEVSNIIQHGGVNANNRAVSFDDITNRHNLYKYAAEQ